MQKDVCFDVFEYSPKNSCIYCGTDGTHFFTRMREASGAGEEMAAQSLDQ